MRGTAFDEEVKSAMGFEIVVEGARGGGGGGGEKGRWVRLYIHNILFTFFKI